MNVIVRMENLPLSASTRDIRDFFSGLQIPDGGVKIIGGDKGEVFITFSTDEDARRAFFLNETKLKGETIKLFVSSNAEMETIFMASQARILKAQQEEEQQRLLQLQLQKQQQQQQQQQLELKQQLQLQHQQQLLQNLPLLITIKNQLLQNAVQLAPQFAQSILAAGSQNVASHSYTSINPAVRSNSPEVKKLDNSEDLVSRLDKRSRRPMRNESFSRSWSRSISRSPVRNRDRSRNRSRSRERYRKRSPVSNNYNRRSRYDKAEIPSLFDKIIDMPEEKSRSSETRRDKSYNRGNNLKKSNVDKLSNRCVKVFWAFASKSSIRSYFGNLGLESHNIRYVKNEKHEITGMIYLKFNTYDDKLEALKLHNGQLNSYKVQVHHLDDEEYEKCATIKTDFQSNGDTISDNVQSYSNYNKRVFYIDNLSSDVRKSDIFNRFMELNVCEIYFVPHPVRLGRCRAVVYLKCDTDLESIKEKSGDYVLENGLKLEITLPKQNEETECLIIYNVSDFITMKEIVHFFHLAKVRPLRIHMMLNQLQQCSGRVYVEFPTVRQAVQARSLDGKHFRVDPLTELQLLFVSRTEMNLDLKAKFNCGIPLANLSRKLLPLFNTIPVDVESQVPIDHVVVVENVPASATINDIKNVFRKTAIDAADVHRFDLPDKKLTVLKIDLKNHSAVDHFIKKYKNVTLLDRQLVLKKLVS